MENDNGGSQGLGRRRALQLLGMGAAAGGLFALGACGKTSGGGAESKGSASTGMSCDSPLDEQSKSTRRTLQYLDKAAVPEKNCSSCAQFEAGKYGECGGCKVITGPVRPAGGCLAFAPKTGAAPAPAKSG